MNFNYSITVRLESVCDSIELFLSVRAFLTEIFKKVKRNSCAVQNDDFIVIF